MQQDEQIKINLDAGPGNISEKYLPPDRKKKMQKATEPCAGCLQKINGDNWDVLCWPKKFPFQVNRNGDGQFMYHQAVVHCEEWCHKAARVRYLQQKASQGLITGPERKILDAIDATPLKPLSFGSQRTSDKIANLQRHALFPKTGN